jgi:hypothetical protein
MPTPARTHLPIKPVIAASGILDEDSARDNEADIALLRLPAPGLRGTFARAYDLLTRLVTQVGWDDLLRTRSSVFVMEEEYRKHKTSRSVDGSAGQQTPHADGNDEASTRGIRSPGVAQTSEANSGRTGYGDAQLEVSRSPIPTIRISSESDHERESAATQAQANGKVHPPSTIQEENEAGQGENAAEPEVPISHAQTPEPAHTAAEPFPEPAQAVNGDVKGKQKATLKLEDDETAEESELSFSNKRLCERWLDNLFMVLYEVSRGFARS